jgi:asparagine synthetase A
MYYDRQGHKDDPRAPAYDDSAEVAVERAIWNGDMLEWNPRAVADAVLAHADYATLRTLLAPIWANRSEPAMKELIGDILTDDDLRDATMAELEARADHGEEA